MCNRDGRNTSKDGLYIHFEGKGIRVNDWLKFHPGGGKVLKIFNGRDVTAQFHATHSKEAVALIRTRANASKMTVPGPSKEDQMYLNLRQKYERLGYFSVDRWVILENILKNLAVLIPWFIAVICIFQNSYPWIATLFWSWSMYFQGWVGHDYSHHQWAPSNNIKDTRICDSWCGIMSGVIRGNGVLWWKRRHNTHHVVTNEVGNDPDIKTSPLFIFFNKLELHWFNRFQHIYYLPTLTTLNFYWHFETWQTTITHLLHNKNIRERELATFDVYTVGLFDLLFAFWVYQQGWFYPMFCLWLSGTGTAMVVFATHYAEERLSKEHNLGFIEQTFRTSRNIKGFFGESWVWNYLTNNLSLQKEHHLFPRMPNVYLRKISPEIREFANENGLEYTEDNICQCAMNAIIELKKAVMDM